MIPAMTFVQPAPASSRLSPSKEQAAIRALRQQHNQALAAFDVDGATRLATDDFVMILGGGAVLKGVAAYRDFVAQSFADPQRMRFVRTPDRIDVGATDGFAVAAETGRWTGTAADGGAVLISGRYLVHWTKRPGLWCTTSETYVTLG